MEPPSGRPEIPTPRIARSQRGGDDPRAQPELPTAPPRRSVPRARAGERAGWAANPVWGQPIGATTVDAHTEEHRHKALEAEPPQRCAQTTVTLEGGLPSAR